MPWRLRLRTDPVAYQGDTISCSAAPGSYSLPRKHVFCQMDVRFQSATRDETRQEGIRHTAGSMEVRQ
jgi:hypothetical protein